MTTLKEVPLGATVTLEAVVVSTDRSGKTRVVLPGVGKSGAWDIPSTAIVSDIAPHGPSLL